MKDFTELHALGEAFLSICHLTLSLDLCVPTYGSTRKRLGPWTGWPVNQGKWPKTWVAWR